MKRDLPFQCYVNRMAHTLRSDQPRARVAHCLLALSLTTPIKQASDQSVLPSQIAPDFSAAVRHPILVLPSARFKPAQHAARPASPSAIPLMIALAAVVIGLLGEV